MTATELPIRQQPFELRAAARDLLATSKKVDPDDLARDLIALLPNSEIDRLVRLAVVDTLRKEISLGRHAYCGPIGASRWERHRLAVEGLGDRVFVNGEWAWVAQCTADMLDAYAAEQQARAASIEAHAQRAADLAAELRAAGAETVADLFATRERAAA